MRKLFSIAGLVMILGCLNHTQAQIDTTGYTNQVITGTLQSMDLSSRLRTGGARGSAATRETRSPLSAATFQSVTTSIIPQKLAATAATPAERKRQQAFFTERLREYEALQRERGLPLKDVAHAMGYFLAISYNVHVGNSELGEAHVSAIREQFNELFLTDPKFKTLSNREKQEMYETAAVMASFMIHVYETAEAAGNHQVMEEMQRMARKNLEQTLGAKPENIRFTYHGIEIR